MPRCDALQRCFDNLTLMKFKSSWIGKEAMRIQDSITCHNHSGEVDMHHQQKSLLFIKSMVVSIFSNVHSSTQLQRLISAVSQLPLA